MLTFSKTACMMSPIAIYKKWSYRSYFSSNIRTVWDGKMQMRLCLDFFFVVELKDLQKEMDCIGRMSCLFCPIKFLNANRLTRLNLSFLRVDWIVDCMYWRIICQGCEKVWPSHVPLIGKGRFWVMSAALWSGPTLQTFLQSRQGARCCFTDLHAHTHIPSPHMLGKSLKQLDE